MKGSVLSVWRMHCAAHLWRAAICPICAKVITNWCTRETPPPSATPWLNAETGRLMNSLNTCEPRISHVAAGNPAYLG